MTSVLPRSWQWKPLRDLTTINYGKSASAILSEDGGIPVVGTGGVERYGSDYLYDGESIILGRKGTIDKVGFVGGKFWTIDTAFFLSDFFDDTCVRWLYYFLQNINLRSLNEATGVPSLSRELLYKINVPTPPGKEQLKIAEILSTLDRAIVQTEALIAKQQRIKTGLMQDLLTKGIDAHGNIRSEATHAFKGSPLGRIPVEWEVAPLSEAVDLIVGYAFKSSWFSEDGIKLLRGENVGTGTLDWKDTAYLPPELVDNFVDYRLNANDLVIGMDRTFTKQGFKVSAVTMNDLPCLLVQRVGCFVPVRVPNQFMRLLILSPRYQRELLLQQKGMDIPHLSKSEILAPLVLLPKNEKEMTEIAKRVEAMEFFEKNCRDSLKKYSALKHGLMHDLLTGKVRVTELLKSGKPQL